MVEASPSESEPIMVEIVYYAAASLDGQIATRDGGVDWLPQIEADGEDCGYQDFYASIDAILMGSRTYEKVLRHADWPYAGKPCWVFTRRPLQAISPDVTLTEGPPEKIVEEMTGLNLKRAWIVGGGKLASSFRERGLIGAYGIGLVPAILGGGIPLLAPHGAVEKLMLSGCQTYPDGTVMLWYRKADG
jgi:dihydrofolate reductase